LFDQAAKELTRRDRTLAAIIRNVGPCMLTPRRDYFVALCEAIVSQQLSTKAANTIFRRFRDLFPRRRPTPAAVADLAADQFRSVGLSGQKTKYMRDLADHFTNGAIPVRKIPRMTDDEITEALTAVKGIGVWTAHMFLIFVLNRPDVWPVGDLGIRRAVQLRYGLDDLPAADQLHQIAQPWKPYRTTASWYLWRSLGNDPLRDDSK
jgi:DNA-3-methyladenine glycosylase II